MAPLLLGALLGGGLGAVKSIHNKKLNDDQDAYRRAVIQYSPWTGMSDPGGGTRQTGLMPIVSGAALGGITGGMFGGAAPAAAEGATAASGAGSLGGTSMANELGSEFGKTAALSNGAASPAGYLSLGKGANALAAPGLIAPEAAATAAPYSLMASQAPAAASGTLSSLQNSLSSMKPWEQLMMLQSAQSFGNGLFGG